MLNSLAIGYCCCLYGECRQRHYYVFDFVEGEWKDVYICNDWLKLEIAKDDGRIENPVWQIQKILQDISRFDYLDISSTNRRTRCSAKENILHSYFVFKLCRRPSTYVWISCFKLIKHLVQNEKSYLHYEMQSSLLRCFNYAIDEKKPTIKTGRVINKMKAIVKTNEFKYNLERSDKFTDLMLLMLELETIK